MLACCARTDLCSARVAVVVLQPIEIYVDDESKLTLHGLQQYYVKLTEAQKNRKLNDLLDALDFNQVVIFVNGVRRAKELNKLLNECNFPSMAIYGGLEQEERLERYNKFKVHTHTHTHPIITCAPKRKGGDITAYFPAAQRQRVVTHSVTRQGQGPPAPPPPPPPPGRGPPRHQHRQHHQHLGHPHKFGSARLSRTARPFGCTTATPYWCSISSAVRC